MLIYTEIFLLPYGRVSLFWIKLWLGTLYTILWKGTVSYILTLFVWHPCGLSGHLWWPPPGSGDTAHRTPGRPSWLGLLLSLQASWHVSSSSSKGDCLCLFGGMAPDHYRPSTCGLLSAKFFLEPSRLTWKFLAEKLTDFLTCWAAEGEEPPPLPPPPCPLAAPRLEPGLYVMCCQKEKSFLPPPTSLSGGGSVCYTPACHHLHIWLGTDVVGPHIGVWSAPACWFSLWVHFRLD